MSVQPDALARRSATYSDQARREEDGSEYSDELHIFTVLLRRSCDVGLDATVSLLYEIVQLHKYISPTACSPIDGVGTYPVRDVVHSSNVVNVSGP